MQTNLVAFVHILRSHDVRVSPAETLDALAVLNALGYADRTQLRLGLAAALAKSEQEEQTFNRCFDRYFSQDEADFSQLAEEQSPPAAAADAPPAAPVADAGNGNLELAALTEAAESSDQLRALLQAPLMQNLLANARGELSAAMRRAGAEAGVSEIQMFTQKGQYTRKILQAMGEEQLRNAVIELERNEDPALDTLRRYRDILREQVRDYVEDQYLLHAQGQNRQFLDGVLAKARLSNIERHYAERVRELVQKMVRRLANRHSSRRKRVRRGQLDMARTLRAGIAHDGVLFKTHWRSRQRKRAQVLAICDVSGSVAAYAKFLLIFLYSLQDILPRMRSFAFSSHLGEVSELFATHPMERAVELVNWRYGGATDYGSSLRDFARLALNDINRSTSVIILGDARNNRGNPELEIMQSIYQRSKQVIWLNPESRRSWGTGDSEMLRYLSACHTAAECNNLQQLERVIDQLLRSTR